MPAQNAGGEAPSCLARVGNLAIQIERARDSAAVVELLEEACRCLGIDAAMFVSFMQDDATSSSFRYLLACDPCWCVEYEANAWYADDPWLGYARRHPQPIRTAKIYATNQTQRSVVQLAARFGFASAAIVPVPAGGGLSRVGMLCLGSRDEGYFDGLDFAPFKVAARMLATSLHDWTMDMIGKDLLATCALTADDLALLEFESRGLGSKAIARLLRSTPGAIDARFHRILKRLSVQSRSAAAHRAAEHGLIAYAPPAWAGT